ncbi:methyl-accepting chemotaxis protein [Devosia sp. SL43]|uniref:methyl-accepting chemotaxis protein n=1 Tax=Devosia sp. SL43 TaxID=2806348 RepID=UPI001F018581|nr:methyl-accepting chemotaxis protein [Devosia sp. SL43]
MRTSSRALKSATGEILAGANDLADRTSRSAASVEETAAAIEQLSQTVLENSQRANAVVETVQTVNQTAERTGQVMQQAEDAMARITTSSGRISNIIGLIDDIAFQTNLLALNASVEAARAGDAGKGFAVVAIEVRRLAQSAASASADVKVLIEESSVEVTAGTRFVAEAAENLGTVLTDIRTSSQLVASIAKASKEQAVTIGEVSGAVRQVDEMTQHNAALVEQTNAAIEQTERQVAELDRIVDVFVRSDPAQGHVRAAARAA